MKYIDIDDLDQDQVKDFADFSDLYRFLRKLLAILLTGVLIYLGL